jgi:hypothetical protein
MKTAIAAALCGALAAALGGCSTTRDVPLLFGSSNVVGISVGASAAGSGADFTLGYKGHDFALVPVTVRQPDGSEPRVGSGQTGVSDAYSVLGQFGASGGRDAGQVKTSLGKFFATGMAARTLAGGFAQKLGGTDENKPCWPKPAATATDSGTATTATAPSPAPSASGPAQPAAAPAAAAAPAGVNDAEGGKLLLFAQITSLGFSAGSTAAQSGVDLTLGYKDANVAVVPVTARDGAGVGAPLRSRIGQFYDSYSVLGQFSFDASQSATLGEAGLGKFFATGGAATRLSQGFAIRLCDEHAAVKASN